MRHFDQNKRATSEESLLRIIRAIHIFYQKQKELVESYLIEERNEYINYFMKKQVEKKYWQKISKNL